MKDWKNYAGDLHYEELKKVGWFEIQSIFILKTGHIVKNQPFSQVLKSLFT